MTLYKHMVSLVVYGLWLYSYFLLLLGECMALWGKPNEISIQHHVDILIQYVDS